jgi:hypothetical protein
MKINTAYEDVVTDQSTLNDLPDDGYIHGTFVESQMNEDHAEGAEALSEGPGLEDSAPEATVLRNSVLTSSGDCRTPAERIKQAGLGTKAHMRLGQPIHMYKKEWWKVSLT